MADKDFGGFPASVPPALPSFSSEEENPLRTGQDLQSVPHQQQIPGCPIRNVLPVLPDAISPLLALRQEEGQAHRLLLNKKGGY